MFKRSRLLRPPSTEDEIFKFVQWELVLLGCWTSVQSYEYLTYSRAVLNATLNMVAVVSECAFTYVNRNNLLLVLDCMCPTLTMGVTSFKIFMLVWRTKELNGIFDTIKDAFKKEVAEKGVIARKWIPLQGFYFTIFLTVATSFTSASFLIMPLLFNVQHMLKGETFVPELPFKLVWPFYHLVSPIYEIMYVYLIYLSLVTQFGISGTDTLLLDIYLHIGALMKIVTHDLDNLENKCFGGTSESVMKFTKAQNKRLYCEVRKIIQKHQFCLELCERVRKFFSEIIFIHFASASLIICLSLIDLILAPGISKAIYVNYIIAATSQVFIYSLAGGHLETTSLDIARATYDVAWHRMDTRTKNLISMLILQGQQPVQIKAPFVTASLATFASICQAAQSYVTLLLTFV